MPTAARRALPYALAHLALRYFDTKLQPRLARPEINFGRLRRLLTWHVEHHNISHWFDILPFHWQEYNRLRADAGVGPEMRRKELQELVSFLRWCERQQPDGPRRADLFAGEGPSVPLSLPKALSPRDERRLLLAAALIQDGGWRLETGNGKAAWTRQWPPGAFYTLCLLGLRLGLRPGELQYLAWDELHLEADTPHVRLRDIVADNGRPIRRLKNRLASTPLALPEDCLRALQGLRSWQTAAGSLRLLVFAVPSARRACGWEPANYDFIWDALRHRLGLPWLNCYTLRHTFATRLIERDPPLDPHYRRRLMRHVYDSTAERYYIQRGDGASPLNPDSGRPERA